MVGIGALADSFYEYILKIWLISKQTNDIIGAHFSFSLLTLNKARGISK